MYAIQIVTSTFSRWQCTFLFLFVSFAFSGQRKPSFQWNMGLRIMCVSEWENNNKKQFNKYLIVYSYPQKQYHIDIHMRRPYGKAHTLRASVLIAMITLQHKNMNMGSNKRHAPHFINSINCQSSRDSSK